MNYFQELGQASELTMGMPGVLMEYPARTDRR